MAFALRGKPLHEDVSPICQSIYKYALPSRKSSTSLAPLLPSRAANRFFDYENEKEKMVVGSHQAQRRNGPEEKRIQAIEREKNRQFGFSLGQAQ